MPFYCIVILFSRPFSSTISNCCWRITWELYRNTLNSWAICTYYKTSIVRYFKSTSSSITSNYTNISYIWKAIDYNHICNCCSSCFILYIQGICYIFSLHAFHIVFWHWTVTTSGIILRILLMICMSIICNSLYRRCCYTGKGIRCGILIFLIKTILTWNSSWLCISMNSQFSMVCINTILRIISGFDAGGIFNFKILTGPQFEIAILRCVKSPWNCSLIFVYSWFNKCNFAKYFSIAFLIDYHSVFIFTSFRLLILISAR